MDWGVQQATWMDVAIIIVLLGGVFIGMNQGMVRQMFSLLGLFFGAVIASQRYQDLTEYLGFIGDPNWQKVIAFALITVAILIAATMVGEIIRRVLSLMLLGCADRLAGGVLGAVESFLLVETALILMYKYPILGVVESIEESKIALQILQMAPTVLAVLPPEFDVIRQLLR